MAEVNGRLQYPACWLFGTRDGEAVGDRLQDGQDPEHDSWVMEG